MHTLGTWDEDPNKNIIDRQQQNQQLLGGAANNRKVEEKPESSSQKEKKKTISCFINLKEDEPNERKHNTFSIIKNANSWQLY